MSGCLAAERAAVSPATPATQRLPREPQLLLRISRGSGAVNLACLAAAALWLFVDERAAAAWQRIVGEATLRCEGPVLLASVLLAGGALSLAGAVLQFVLGAARRRRLRSLLAIATLACLWCGLAVNAPEISWQGKRWRLSRSLAPARVLAAELAAEWPAEDGRHPRLGPFMAYPVGEPRVLLPLTPPALGDAGPFVSAVERLPGGVIRLELSGGQAGDWVEWRPDGSEPASLRGGLGENFVLLKHAELARDWRLVRYRLDSQPGPPAP